MPEIHRGEDRQIAEIPGPRSQKERIQAEVEKFRIPLDVVEAGQGFQMCFPHRVPRAMAHERMASGDERRGGCHRSRCENSESYVVRKAKSRSRGGQGRSEAAKPPSPAHQDEIGKGFVGWKEAAVPACDAAGILKELRKASPDAPGYCAHLKPML